MKTVPRIAVDLNRRHAVHGHASKRRLCLKEFLCRNSPLQVTKSEQKRKNSEKYSRSRATGAWRTHSGQQRIRLPHPLRMWQRVGIRTRNRILFNLFASPSAFRND